MSGDGEWYFEHNGIRQGPITIEDLNARFIDRTVRPDTLVWTPSFGPTWKPADQVEAVTRAGALPPPLPIRRSKVSSFWAWVIAFVPIIGAGIQLVATADGVDPKLLAVSPLLYFVAYIALSAFDSSLIRSRDASLGTPIVWAWLAPLYLYKRSRLLGHSLATLWTWIAAVLIGIVLTETDLATKDMYWGAGLPSCESSTVQSQARDLFDRVPIIILSGSKAREIQQIREVSATETARECVGAMISTAGQIFAVTYSVSLHGDDIGIELNIVGRR